MTRRAQTVPHWMVDDLTKPRASQSLDYWESRIPDYAVTDAMRALAYRYLARVGATDMADMLGLDRPFALAPGENQALSPRSEGNDLR